MTAMILAAGLGSRMRPLTDKTPKPLLEVGGKPLIVWHIERLKQAGFERIVINIAYLGDQIKNYLGDGSQFGVEIQFSDEQEEGPLETAGGIVKALPYLSETFLVVNGDVWTEYDFLKRPVLAEHCLCHLILVENPQHNPQGDFFLTDTDKKYTFSGIGYYKKALFSTLGYGKAALAPLLFDAIENMQVSTALYEGQWHDIGTPERLRQVNRMIAQSE